MKSAPKGFGVVKKAPAKFPQLNAEEEKERRPKREAEDDTVPEVVTNRMLRRMGFTVGVPLLVGLLAYPGYYYLKALYKIEVSPIVPMITSFLTFGGSAVGIIYAILSSSWDPQIEGSILGWKEAQVNWGLVWEKKIERDDD